MNASPSGAAVDSWMLSGAASHAACTSAAVGDTCTAPGMSVRSATVATMLEPTRSSLSNFSICSWVNSSTKVTTSSVNSESPVSEVTKTPSSEEPPTSSSMWRRSLMTWLSWSTQLIGSVSSFSLGSSTDPTANTTTAATASRTALDASIWVSVT